MTRSTNLMHAPAELSVRAAALLTLGAAAILVGGCSSTKNSTNSALTAAPPEFQSWISTATPACSAGAVTPEFVAAQLQAESGFHTDTTSAANAIGPAQLPPTIRVIDANGNGANAREVADAVTTLVSADCAIADHLTAGGRPADQRSIAAAYNAGLTAVLTGRDLPMETQAYVTKVMASQ